MANQSNIALLERLLNMFLKVRREIRATNGEKRAKARETRATEKHNRQYFGRSIK